MIRLGRVPRSRAAPLILVAAIGLSTVSCDRAQDAPPTESMPDLLAWDETTIFDLDSGEATLGCEPIGDPASSAGRMALVDVGVEPLRELVRSCLPTHTIHLDYTGPIHRDFAELIRVLSDLAEEVGVRRRILDADSPGGDVVMAMHAGDVMGDLDWAMRVRAGASCNSACIMLLAAARYRVVHGEVGIHRVFPARSQATSREELARDLEAVVELIRVYLAKHGASPALVDAMMAVPASEIRVLSESELEAFGLLGANAAQQDLERVRLVQRCGMDFVRRSEAWDKAFESECEEPAVAGAMARGESPRTVQCAIVSCGLELQARFEFPDPACPTEIPVTRTGAWLLCEDRPRPPAPD